LNASASSAGALLSGSVFEVPQFQREYSWQEDEVADFWNDLRTNIESESYFLGLVILTDEAKQKHVVDGQRRRQVSEMKVMEISSSGQTS